MVNQNINSVFQRTYQILKRTFLNILTALVQVCGGGGGKYRHAQDIALLRSKIVKAQNVSINQRRF